MKKNTSMKLGVFLLGLIIAGSALVYFNGNIKVDEKAYKIVDDPINYVNKTAGIFLDVSIVCDEYGYLDYTQLKDEMLDIIKETVPETHKKNVLVKNEKFNVKNFSAALEVRIPICLKSVPYRGIEDYSIEVTMPISFARNWHETEQVYSQVKIYRGGGYGETQYDIPQYFKITKAEMDEKGGPSKVIKERILKTFKNKISETLPYVNAPSILMDNIK